MDFYIQASNPIFSNEYNGEDEQLSEAIESSFILFTENAILMWNHIAIPLSYKYDISYMVNDILTLLNCLMSEQQGERTIHWLPDTFRCDWEIQWNKQKINISSHWESTVGHLETILNINSKISMTINEFMQEWKKILEIVIEGLKVCGYNSDFPGIKRLMLVYDEIPSNGILYQK